MADKKEEKRAAVKRYEDIVKPDLDRNTMQKTLCRMGETYDQ